MTTEKETPTADAPWVILVGGVHACKQDGAESLSVRMSAMPVCVYRHIDTAQLQGLWAFFNDPAIHALFYEFEAKLAAKLTELGTAYGLQRGTLTEASVKELQAMAAKITSK